jgi:polysaccharide export outer membrane protein
MWRRSLAGLLLAGLLLTGLLFAAAALRAQSPRIPAAEAIQHVGEHTTVCGPIAGRHPSGTLPNLPAFIDLGTPFPKPTFTVILWDSDRKTVGDLPSSGNICVTGTILQYKGVPLMVLSSPNSWVLQSAPPDPSPPVVSHSAPSASVAAAPVPRSPLPAPSNPSARVVTAPDPSSSAPPPIHRPAAAPPSIPSDFLAPSSSYRIGADDSLQITVWREPGLSGTFLVRPDGKISLVLVGDVRATGLTPMDLAGNLTERFRKFLQDPLVSVIVLAPNSQKVYVLGEVQRAGPINMTTAMSPLQAIATAGGLTPYAAQKKIYILRGPEGSQHKIPFNYKSALNARPSSSVRLLAGDTIVVP